jgi:hypothetical protein
VVRQRAHLPQVSDGGYLIGRSIWLWLTSVLRHKLPVATIRDGYQYWFRRPGFLEALDHVQYGAAEAFLEEAHYHLPHPASLVRELEDVGEKLKQLNFFTVYFVQPTWAPKANAQKELEPFSFAQLIGNAYCPLPSVQDPQGEVMDGAVTPAQYQQAKEDNRQRGQNFIRLLRLKLVGHMTGWRKAVVGVGLFGALMGRSVRLRFSPVLTGPAASSHF